MSDQESAVRCSVCGETFQSERAVRDHLYDQGLIW